MMRQAQQRDDTIPLMFPLLGVFRTLSCLGLIDLGSVCHFV